MSVPTPPKYDTRDVAPKLAQRVVKSSPPEPMTVSKPKLTGRQTGDRQTD